MLEVVDGMRPGMSATVDIITAERLNTLSIPIQSLTSSRSGKKGANVVFVYNEGFVEERVVNTGIVGDRDYEVISGLNDDKWKNVESKLFLQHATIKIKKIGWEIENIDSVILLQKPKIAHHIPSIKRGLSKIMNIKESQLSIKATTTDSLGYIGKQQGWAAQAVALVRKI